MINDEDKYVTKKELIFYVLILICFITYTNIIQDKNSLMIWEANGESKMKIWGKQHKLDSAIVYTIKKNH